jgi:hypothetical protein
MQSMKILEGDAVLLSQPLLIEQFGRAGAQFLSQLHYWLNHNQNLGTVADGVKWIFNTESQWAEQLKLSVRQVRRYISMFVSKEIIRVEKLHPCKSIRTNYYSIDYKKLEFFLNTKDLNNPGNGRNVHEDILSASSGHNGPLYIQRLPNKEINKSEDQTSEIDTNQQLSKNSFKPVKELKNIGEKNREGCQESVSSEIDSTQPSKVNDDIGSDKVALPKNNTAQAMLKAWNDTFSFSEKMSKELAPLLVSAYNSKFSKNLKYWETYMGQIKSSAYLTSEKFNLSIFWALKFSIIDRIRAGEFGVKKEFVQDEQNRVFKTLEEVKQEITQIKSESVKAHQLRHKVLDLIGIDEYLAWFHKAKFLENKDGGIYLEADNAFAESMWKQKYDWVSAIKSN